MTSYEERPEPPQPGAPLPGIARGEVAVIYNPSAGRERGAATAEAVARYLEREGLRATLHPTQGPRHAVTLARRLAPRTDIIVAVGGDGTINEVVNGMAQAAEPEQVGEDRRPACRLGIVPAGTVNVVALELKLPFKAEDACRVIAGGHTRALDLGKVNDRRFVLMTGAGIDALTIQHLDPRLKKRLRSLAFVGTGLTEGLSHQQPEFVVTIDGAQYRATFFVASNFRYYAGHLAMAPKADPADGLLDMMLFHGTTKQSLLTFWWRLLARTHVRWRNVTCVQAARAELSPLSEEEPVWLQADGEIVGKLPAVVEIEPAAIEVLVP